MTPIDAFKAKAPEVVGWIMRDFALPDFAAAGVVGNTGRECLGFTVLREIGQPPGYGGYGWQQWTGPRRKLFLNWCANKGLDWRSDAGNYGYLKHELLGEDPANSYAFVVTHLRECKDVAEAAVAFEKFYERAGVPALTDRIKWAQIALDAYHASQAPA